MLRPHCSTLLNSALPKLVGSAYTAFEKLQHARSISSLTHTESGIEAVFGAIDSGTCACAHADSSHHAPSLLASAAGVASAWRQPRHSMSPHAPCNSPILPHSHSPLSGSGQARHFASQAPETTVYSGPSVPSPKRVTLRVLRNKYQKKEPISMVTAYDYPSAVHVDMANIDILLVGDSVAMVVHGHDTTLPVTMDEMLVHCRAVARGARRAFLVGDMPFGSYETGVRDAVISATRMLKEGGMDAVKLEGGSPARVEAARAIVEAGVAVMGHVGLTPQSVSVIGGFRPQAQVADEALGVLKQALALQAAGCFAIVLECVPGPIAAAITAALSIPTIGIGAGAQTSGQVLVYHDLLGMMSHPHHAKVTPKFCKQYAHVGNVIQAALQQYRDEVTAGAFPTQQFTPYRIAQAEVSALASELRANGHAAAADALEAEALNTPPPANSSRGSGAPGSGTGPRSS